MAIIAMSSLKKTLIRGGQRLSLGFVCGDDYMDGKHQVEKLKFGVIPAVDEFREQNKLGIESFELIKDQFAIKKKMISHEKGCIFIHIPKCEAAQLTSN